MKVRKELKIEKDLLDKLEALAKLEGRNLSNFIKKILSDYVDSKK